MNTYIKSPLNYTGGKYKLLPQIMPLFPDDITDFWDLFCGGANVGINVSAERVIYNDSNQKLIGLFNTISKQDFASFDNKVHRLIKQYGLSNSTEKGYDFYRCSSNSGLGSFNKSGFAKLRDDFNKMNRRDDKYYLYLFVLITFAFNNQIRFNSVGHYNLPVGKRDYNSNIRKNLESFMNALSSQDSVFISKDFRKINIEEIREGSLIYCDPPYLITTASYNEMGGWTEKEEYDLLSFLDKLNECGLRFALSNVLHHKGRSNDILLEWAPKYNVHNLSFNYANSSYHGKNTNEETQEVLITNY